MQRTTFKQLICFLSSTELLTRGSQHMHPFWGHRWAHTSPSILINSRIRMEVILRKREGVLKCNWEDCVSVAWILQLLRVKPKQERSGEVLREKAGGVGGERWGNARTTFSDFLYPKNSPGICSWNSQRILGGWYHEIPKGSWGAGRPFTFCRWENRGSEGLIS